ncbi:MAG TPA: hypothetical protein PLX66_00380 [Bacilli bacterium]|nr:hypothetical protein [Bacilli bacterium]
MTFCTDAASILGFVGTILFVFKIAIPILLIVLGSIDLGKAVVAQSEDEIKKATGMLGKRALFGIVIFFIPTIIGLVFNLVGSFKEEYKDQYEVCQECIVHPFSGNCE